MHVNGYELAYVAYGAGVPIVLVHGELSDYRAFTAQMEPFSATHRAISLSLRHYYPEPWDGNGSDFSYQQHAWDVAAFIKALDAGPVHLVGHSRGGTVAMCVATEYPELVRSLVVAEGGRNIATFMPRRGRYAGEARQFAAMSDRVLTLLGKGRTEEALSMFAAALDGSRAWQAWPESVRQACRDNVWTLLGMAADSDDAYTCADARRIAAPTLLLGADRGLDIYRLVQDRIQACMRGAQRGWIASVSHNIPQANPSAFKAAVLAFVAMH